MRKCGFSATSEAFGSCFSPVGASGMRSGPGASPGRCPSSAWRARRRRHGEKVLVLKGLASRACRNSRPANSA
jgi:hypothetical protein